MFDALNKRYGNRTALNGLSLTLTEGVYGLLGPNGAGKSTLLNILTGNLKQTDGQILYNGQDIEVLGRSFQRQIGYMPQQQTLYPGFTAWRFLDYMASLRGLTGKIAKVRIDEVLEQVGLADRADNRISTFSGGMKNRLLIAQAILADPKILILDEPTAGLDPSQRIAIRNLLASLAGDKIVLIATHVVQDVEYIAREILLLQQGELLRRGHPAELCAALEGKVFSVLVPEEALPQMQARYKIGNISREGSGLSLRLLAQVPPSDYPWQLLAPTLEDVYLYYCEA